MDPALKFGLHHEILIKSLILESCTVKREILFSGNDMALMSVGLPSGGPVCITFSPLRPRPTSCARLFGFYEKFLNDRSIPALHFISHWNHCWQTEEMQECLAIGFETTRQSERRIGYGSSMGAYASLKFSEILQLDSVAAFSPQFSVDPAKVPWEKRWSDDRAKIRFIDDEMLIRNGCDCFVFFDPIGPDGVHVKLLECVKEVSRIEMPGAGHLVLKKLAAFGLLEEIITGIIYKSIDHARILSMIDGMERWQAQQA